MVNNKLKIRNYLYFSTLHISEKVTNKDIKFKTISLLTNMTSIFCLGFCIIIFGIIENMSDINININVNDNIVGYFIGLVFLVFFINQVINKIYEKYKCLPISTLLEFKNTVNKGILNWFFPIMAIFSIAFLSISVIVGDLIK